MNKKIFKSILLITMLVMAVSFAGGCSENGDPAQKDNSEATGKTALIMGTNAEFPPFEFIGDNGEPDGFDVALVKEIAKRLNVEIKIENMEFKSLPGAISTGKIDLIAAGMTVTDERKLELDFSDTYFKAIQKIVIPVDSEIKSGLDLKGKSVGVQEGTTGDFTVSEEETPDAEKVYNVKEIKRYRRGLDAVNDMINGRSDAVVIDSNPAEEYVKANKDKVIAIDSGMEPEDYAIAVKKGNTELLNRINGALREMRNDGTFDKLVTQYIQ